jgi:hypothetical protein
MGIEFAATAAAKPAFAVVARNPRRDVLERAFAFMDA